MLARRLYQCTDLEEALIVVQSAMALLAEETVVQPTHTAGQPHDVNGWDVTVSLRDDDIKDTEA